MVLNNSKHDLPIYTVSALSRKLKKIIGDSFGKRVCVKGEVSQPKRQGSNGHYYFRLKDEESVVEAVGWKNVVEQWSVYPTEGMEVLCKGELTTYSLRSQYQIIVDSLECTGEGAWLKLLEDRKRRLTAEGLFDRPKKPLPPFPNVIGLITSPQGAALQDILHRLKERFPLKVLLCPVTVEGKTAATQITAAFETFKKLPPNTPRPDVLIVARGGGTLESLMPFNEEIVVRTAATCPIPLITAIGHETDTTLIDYIADLRVPTPTAAAEKAVPVRTELSARLRDLDLRLVKSIQYLLKQSQKTLSYLKQRLLYISSFLDPLRQRLDDTTENYQRAFSLRKNHYYQILTQTQQRLSLHHPLTKYQSLKTSFSSTQKQLQYLGTHIHQHANTLLQPLSLSPSSIRLKQYIQEKQTYIHLLGQYIEKALYCTLLSSQQRLHTSSLLMDAFEYRRTLQRGYVLVCDTQKRIISHTSMLHPEHTVSLHFADKTILATIHTLHAPNTETLYKKPHKEKNPQLKLF